LRVAAETRSDRLSERQISCRVRQIGEEQGEAILKVRALTLVPEGLAVNRDRVCLPTLGSQDLGEEQPPFDEIRVAGKRRSETFLGRAEIPGRKFDNFDETDGNQRIVGGFFEEGLDLLDRLLLPVQRREVPDAVEARLQETGIEFERLIDQLESALVLPATVFDVRFDLQRLRAPRRHGARRGGHIRRLIQPTQVEQAATQIPEGGEVLRVPLEDAADSGDGFDKLALDHQPVDLL
jgi:hypothetical protein